MENKSALVMSLGARTTGENYGAILQMYCFCRVLEKRYQINSTIMDYVGVSALGYKANDIAVGVVYGKAKSIKEKIKKWLFSGLIKKRYLNNLDFLRKEIGMTETISFQDINSKKFNYDYYIAESDVIWDPTFRSTGFDDTFFLNRDSFQHGIKVVYAAGLGDCAFSREDICTFKDKIKNIDFVSVREKMATSFIGKHFSIDIPYVLDPTLLLDCNDYLFHKTRATKKDYVLVYSPGFYNKKMVADAKKYAHEHGKKIIIVKRAMSLEDFFVSKVNISVKRFVDLLDNCFTFFCDSFHGICLSVVFRKQFYAYNRPDGLKMFDICERLSLTRRIVVDSLDDQDIDYDEVYKLLAKEREFSFSFLDRVFATLDSN